MKNYVSDWQHLDDQWNIPNEEEFGKIEEITTTRVLSLTGKYFVNLKTQKDSDYQIWIRGKTMIDGYFTLTNKASKTLLTNFGLYPFVYGNHLLNCVKHYLECHFGS